MTEHGEARAARPGWIWLAAILAAVALVVTVTVVALRSTSDPSPRKPAAAPAASPTPSPTPSPSAPPAPPPGADIKGPLNFLLTGVDTRISKPGWQPRSDAVLILHVTKNLDRAYLFSLPRDLLVDVPRFPKAGYAGGRTKLTHAMMYGSRVPGQKNSPSMAQGYELLSMTVSRYTGIKRFDGGAVITFQGFTRLVNALGGVNIYVDQRVVSIHRQPDGQHRTPGPGVHGYVGPQMVYEKGNRRMNGWQALDYARQRYIPGGDYSRQRHQQQLIRALVRKILDEGWARDPDQVTRVVRALDKTLVYRAPGGRSIVEFAYALSGLPPTAFVTVGLPGQSVFSGGGYRGESLSAAGRRFITELRAGRAEAYLAAHPGLRVRT